MQRYKLFLKQSENIFKTYKKNLCSSSKKKYRFYDSAPIRSKRHLKSYRKNSSSVSDLGEKMCIIIREHNRTSMRNRMIFFLATSLLATTAMQAQDVISLHGRVTAKGKGVPYTTLQLQGTSIGVACNDNGDYEMKLPVNCKSDTIIIRSIRQRVWLPVSIGQPQDHCRSSTEKRQHSSQSAGD